MKPKTAKRRKHSPTSKAAYESIKPCKEAIHAKIKEALTRMKVGGTFEQIAAVANLKDQQVWKRLSEMAGLNIIFNTNYTRKGSSGRDQSVWQLYGKEAVNPTSPKTTKQLRQFQQLDLLP